MSKRPVRMTDSEHARLGSPREWGLPTGLYPGKVWHSKARQTVTCITGFTANGERVRLDTRPFVVVGGGERWWPAKWLRAMPRYVRDWPASARLERTVVG